MSPAIALLAALALGQAPAPPPADTFKPDLAWKPLGPSLWFDPAGRRVVIRARVTLVDGALEHLLCRKATKEHEAILATEAPARQIHAGLLLTGAEPGHPVRFQPDFAPPSGSAIAIDLEWDDNGTVRRADARDWVRDERKKGGKLAEDWVFAGSMLVEDPRTKKPFYVADEGDLITVANFPGAILDLPFASTADDSDRVFAADPAKIPPRGTPVTLFLKPRAAGKPAPR